MRLDHLLSKEDKVERCVLLFSYQGASAQDGWNRSDASLLAGADEPDRLYKRA